MPLYLINFAYYGISKGMLTDPPLPHVSCCNTEACFLKMRVKYTATFKINRNHGTRSELKSVWWLIGRYLAND